MPCFLDWLIAMIVGKALASQHQRWLIIQDLGQAGPRKSYDKRPSRPGDQIRSRTSNCFRAPSAALLNSKPLAEYLYSMADTPDPGLSEANQKPRTRLNGSLRSISEPVVSKSVAFMTMPERHYNCVHSHHSVTSSLIGVDELESLAIMQCRDQALMDARPINPERYRQDVPNPVRVVVPSNCLDDLERLPRMTSGLAQEIEAEMKRQIIIRREAAPCAEARASQERHAIREYKAIRKEKFPPPIYVPQVASSLSEDIRAKDGSRQLDFFPRLPDDGDLCPYWSMANIAEAVQAPSQIGSSKQPELNRLVPPRIRTVENAAKMAGGPWKEYGVGAESKLAPRRGPSVHAPEQKKKVERKGLRRIKRLCEAIEGQDGSIEESHEPASACKGPVDETHQSAAERYDRQTQRIRHSEKNKERCTVG